MSKKSIPALSLILVLSMILVGGFAEAPADVIGTWYLVEYQDLDNYPNITFRGNGDDDFFTVYTDGSTYLLIDNNDHMDKSYEYTDGVLCHSGDLSSGYKPVGDQLVRVLSYEGADHAVYTYARQPAERQVADYRGWGNCEHVDDFDGEWIIVKYGMNGAFADAAEMNLEGEAVIENGHMTLVWTRDGEQKNAELTFDGELNHGRLYMIKNESVSYIVTRTNYNTLVLNIGLNQTQWVFSRKNQISEEPVYAADEVFEAAYAEREDWFASEETRNQLAALLFQAAVRNGANVNDFDLEGGVYLTEIGGTPLLVIGGAGPYKDFVFSVGRTTPTAPNGIQIYSGWHFYIRGTALYDGDDRDTISLAALYSKDVLSYMGEVWQAEINPE